MHEGVLYRFGRRCSRRHGDRVVALKVGTLTATAFAEVHLQHLFRQLLKLFEYWAGHPVQRAHVEHTLLRLPVELR